MGGPMLAAMLRAGLDVRGYDIRPLDEFGALAAHMTRDLDAFATDLDVVFTVVRDIAETEALLFGQSGLLTAARELKILVICSTLSPRFIDGLRARVPDHIALVDAPMSGAEVAAREARLSFMLGGNADDIARLKPFLQAMGAHFHVMGAYGAGMKAKVLNNLLAAASTVMTRQVLDWASEFELDAEKLLALIDTSSGQNWFASGFEQIEFAKTGYRPENTLGILRKDVLSALDAAPKGRDQRLGALLAEMIEALAPYPSSK